MGLRSNAPGHTNSIPEIRKPRKHENSKARDQASSLTNRRCPPRPTPCKWGRTCPRMRKAFLRCATRKSASAKPRNGVFTNNGAPELGETGYQESGKAGKRESGKAAHRKGRAAIASSSTRRRQSWEASFRTGYRTGHHRSLACRDRYSGSVRPSSGLPRTPPFPAAAVVAFSCCSSTRCTRRIA